jgi:hypothetical protein
MSANITFNFQRVATKVTAQPITILPFTQQTLDKLKFLNMSFNHAKGRIDYPTSYMSRSN